MRRTSKTDQVTGAGRFSGIMSSMGSLSPRGETLGIESEMQTSENKLL